MRAANKRRICSIDMAKVPPDGYVLTEEQGEMYFCNNAQKNRKDCLRADDALRRAGIIRAAGQFS